MKAGWELVSRRVEPVRRKTMSLILWIKPEVEEVQ